jgi:hypothetical protein
MVSSHPAWRRRILAVAVTSFFTLALSSCGNDGEEAVEVAAASPKPDCPVQPGALDPSDAGTGDFADPGEGGLIQKDNPEQQKPQSTEEALAYMDLVGVLEVVSRRAPVAAGRVDGRPRTGAIPSTQVSAAPGRTDVDIVRPIKGSFPSQCLDLDVPGGTVGKLRHETSRFPEKFKKGDRVLAISAADPFNTVYMYLADKDGWLTLPFGDMERVNVNTWSPTILPRPTSSLGPDDHTLPPSDGTGTAPPPGYSAPPRPPEKG